MKAVILAGGKGTRLAHLTKQIPKPLIEIGGKPVLEHQINLLARYGIRDIILLVGYLKQQIIDYFGNGQKWNVRISYFQEQQPLGTVGGLTLVSHLLTDDFLLLYGDVMMNMDLERLLKFHRQKQSELTLVVHPNDHPHDSDLVDVDRNDRVIGFYPKPHPEDQYFRNLVNAGLYVMSPKIFQYLKRGQKADFGKDVLPKVINHLQVYAYNTSEYLKDMGTPERLEQVRRDYQTGIIERKSYRYKQKAIFLDRDGTINVYKGLIYKPEDFELYDFAAEAIRLINRSDYLAIVVTNQPVVARNLCTIEELEYIHKKMETLLGRQGAKLDAIYYCPHHPDKGYPDENPAFKIDCPCRKPKPGMLLRAAERFNIDLSQSFIIGDSFFDVLTGYNAGVTTVGLRTGVGLSQKDRDRFISKGYTLQEPHYVFDNLLEAVKAIVQ